MDHVLQPLRSGSVAAVVDVHPAVGQAVRLHFQHHALQCAVLAAGLAKNLQITGIAGLPDDPDAQHPRHCRHSGLHAAIAGQVGQRVHVLVQGLFVQKGGLGGGVVWRGGKALGHSSKLRLDLVQVRALIGHLRKFHERISPLCVL